ncbi:LuxR family transcriptional regulator [Citrobacter koseri]|uniref:LuxR family transcriptional regulator n=1 Tax=Citrobacter koseri TaxID=545 RepID=A0A3S4J280_CITKO|nr:LuxR family transcriptional regulator [Citrobacter koseri]
MIVISENSFFHLGVSALVERMALNTTRNLIVFDTGRDCLYMLDTEEQRCLFFHEPILIFSHCRRIYLTEKNRKFKIETLLSKTKSHPAVRRKREVLTVSELRVIKKVVRDQSTTNCRTVQGQRKDDQ